MGHERRVEEVHVEQRDDLKEQLLSDIQGVASDLIGIVCRRSDGNQTPVLPLADKEQLVQLLVVHAGPRIEHPEVAKYE